MNAAENEEVLPDVMSLNGDHSRWFREEPVKKRLVLLITAPSLFGGGIMALLAQLGEHVVVEAAPTLRSAMKRPRAVAPDVVAYFKERLTSEEQSLLRGLGLRYGARIIHGTLDVDQLTICDQKQINHATVDDLIDAVLDTNGNR